MVTRLTALVACVGLLAFACSDSSSATTTTITTFPISTSTSTSAPAPVTSAGSSGNNGGAATTTTTTAPAFSIPSFTVVERTPEDVLVILIPPGTYNDIDLRNLVGEVVEGFAPVNSLHIVDDEAAAQLVLAEDLTEVDMALLDEHYFLRLEEGFRMIFLGPFIDVGEVILGS